MDDRKLNVLYLSYDGMTDPLGQSQVLPYIIGLSKLGYHFCLISFEKEEKYEQLKPTISNVCIENNIDWFPLKYTKNPPVLSTNYDLYCLKKKISKLHSIYNFQLIHARSYLAGMVGMKFAKSNNIKFIFDMRGFWVDERVEGNLWNLNNPIFRIIYVYLKNKEKYLFRTADAIISLTHKAVSTIEKIRGHIDKNQLIQVIPCCSDLTHFDRTNFNLEDIKQKKAELNFKEDSFILTYLGGISTWYKPTEMLDFFQVILRKFKNAVFLIVTQEDPDIIYKICERKHIDTSKIKILSANRSEVPLLLLVSNYSVFFINPSFSKEASSPTKQGELMSMGIPIITNKGIGDTEEILKAANAGYVVNAFNEQEYEIVVAQMSEFVSEDIKAQIIQGAFDYFSLEEGVKKYATVYKSLLTYK
jgi:glycosyltransferase involved in cell wall biosynthesis